MALFYPHDISKSHWNHHVWLLNPMKPPFFMGFPSHETTIFHGFSIPLKLYCLRFCQFPQDGWRIWILRRKAIIVTAERSQSHGEEGSQVATESSRMEMLQKLGDLSPSWKDLLKSLLQPTSIGNNMDLPSEEWICGHSGWIEMVVLV